MKIGRKLEKFTSDYCWDNLPGDQLWSNEYYQLVLSGAKIAEKEFKQKILDNLNKYKSQLKQETSAKLTKTVNKDKVRELEIKIETLKELYENDN